MKSKWEPEEDQRLMDAVKKFGDKNWQQVASVLVNRTGQQCLHRWQKTLNPNIKRGKWKPDEDQLLHAAVKMYGTGNWVKVVQRLPVRVELDHLDPSFPLHDGLSANVSVDTHYQRHFSGVAEANLVNTSAAAK